MYIACPKKPDQGRDHNACCPSIDNKYRVVWWYYPATSHARAVSAPFWIRTASHEPGITSLSAKLQTQQQGRAFLLWYTSLVGKSM